MEADGSGSAICRISIFMLRVLTYSLYYRTSYSKHASHISNSYILFVIKIIHNQKFMHIICNQDKLSNHVMYQISKTFIYLKTIFPKHSDAKIKKGVFDGPQIKKMLESEQFQLHLSRNEAAAFNSFRLVVAEFLGNNGSLNFVKIINDLLKN